MLRAGNVPVEGAGNVGRPLCDLAGRVDPATWIACELSSFQLEDIDSFRPRVAVVLQVTPDHLDRHGTFAEYLRSALFATPPIRAPISQALTTHAVGAAC